MNQFVRIAVLGLGAGVGASFLQGQVGDLIKSVGFDPAGKGGSTAAAAISAGVGIFVAEQVLKAL